MCLKKCILCKKPKKERRPPEGERGSDGYLYSVGEVSSPKNKNKKTKGIGIVSTLNSTEGKRFVVPLESVFADPEVVTSFTFDK